jgi:mycobactin lysine-N-oxygenase
MPTLAVVGAGPKGIAIAAKAHALAAAGLDAPRVVLIDPGPVAGNWTGHQGYTSGLLPLGTPPEKDIGFPYPASWGAASAAVTAAMAAFSWPQHLISKGAYADWVDRGRLRPTHRQWSFYLRDVAARARAEVISARVEGVEAVGDRWRLGLSGAQSGAQPGPSELRADGVVFTGTGPSIRVPGQPRSHPRLTTGREYWRHRPRPGPHLAQSICVIGSGETAASVVIDLLRRAHKRSTVDVVTSRGVLYSRGESYAENRFYSDPGDWPALAEVHRREFQERTDRGVFSVQAEAVLNASRGFRTLAGRVVAIDASEHQIVLTTEYGPEQEKVAYDFVVVAIGFESRWFESLLGPAGQARLTAALSGELLDKRIGADLSVTGLAPALHLPMLAGLAQGPGFPNLSCLGLLSDRVLRRYVPRPPDDSPARARERSEHVRTPG